MQQGGSAFERGQLLDQLLPCLYAFLVSEAVKKVTVNLPARRLEQAMKLTGKGITPTIIEGLDEIARRAKRSALRDLRGKIRFELDLEETRR